MRKILKILIIILLLGAAYQFRAEIGTQFAALQSRVRTLLSIAPCSSPISYVIGNFDTKFGISKSYFLSALSDAEAVWEKPSGIDLFAYTPSDSAKDVLKVNLIYDYRQDATSKLKSLGITQGDDRASYDALKAKFASLQTEYKTEKSAFDVRLKVFNQKQKAYDVEVQSWNAKGGAPEAEYNRLQADKASLAVEGTQLQATQTHINTMVDEINALVVSLNRLASILNISVNQYNTINGARGESFEEGVYATDGFSREIDIYEFSSRAKLVRVLAHELGHALGLEHSEDSKAIMYKLNQGTNETLTKADLDALKVTCKIK